MTETPICGFLRDYASKNAVRLHMPGHKGKCHTGSELYDITEIKGADALYECGGIIRRSEEIAAGLFGSYASFYSTEGSSQCIRAMIYLSLVHGKIHGERPVILASRNAHKSFVLACALLDVDIAWLNDEEDGYSLCRCFVTPDSVKSAIKKYRPFAVYITSPDYLGNMLDVKSFAEAAHSFDIPLLVDNAHGAYLRFLPRSLHPMDAGADMCCDSAHKTLPVLTGGAYLHIGGENAGKYAEKAKNAMALFGSTSPSYLILQSLDLCNNYLSEGYRENLAKRIEEIDKLKAEISEEGIRVLRSDPLKLTVCSHGIDLSEKLREYEIECEYEDPDFTVMMFTPDNADDDLLKVKNALSENARILKKGDSRPKLKLREHLRKMSVRDAIFSESENIDAERSAGRTLAFPSIGCPPAVSPVVSGEIITEPDVEIFEYYGIERVDVVK
ncbi:MAG: amino acid decarboxylase [Clostridiales bacterium]|nr:amino acid decarboxylase [Clostridiales bacterium]